MNEKELKKYLSRLESQNDHLVTQIQNIDQLLRKVGFEDGLESLKNAASELLLMQEQDSLYPLDEEEGHS